MTIVIRKIQLSPSVRSTLNLPLASKIIDVELVEGIPHLVVLQPSIPPTYEVRHFFVIPAEMHFPETEIVDLHYIGSVAPPDFVFITDKTPIYVFEIGQPQG